MEVGLWLKAWMTAEIERELGTVDLGDARLDQRARFIVRRWQETPDASFPSMVGSAAELQALYRFMDLETVTWQSLLAAHSAQALARIDEATPGDVLIVHDTTTFSFEGDGVRKDVGWLSPNLQGFSAHMGLALSADGSRRPLGILGMSITTRARATGPRKHRSGKECARDPNRDSLRWKRLVDQTTTLTRGHAVPIHVMDREGDAYELLGGMVRDNQRFVVRAKALGRAVTTKDIEGTTRLRVVAERAVPVATRNVRLSRRKKAELADARRKHPPRPSRPAKLDFAATTVRLHRTKYLTELLPATIDINVVHVRELDPPPDMQPIEWFILTTEAIGTVDEVVRVVDIYRARWTIEEFFKAIKTGCAYEARQLESGHALHNALAMCIPVAWQMLLLRHQVGADPEAPAATVIGAHRLEVLRMIARKPLPSPATARTILFAIAALGGHIEKNGDPGWMTLRRGLDRLIFAEAVLEARGAAEFPPGRTTSGG